MYTTTNLVTAIDHEITVLSHLFTKVETQHHTHKFTDKQRTVKELPCYLAYSPRKQVQYIFDGDRSIFDEMKQINESFDPTVFLDHLTHNWNNVRTRILAADEKTLSETVTLWGVVTDTRMNLLVQVVYAQLMAYKMQLFLQLKHAGKHELVTANLWMGMDPK